MPLSRQDAYHRKKCIKEQSIFYRFVILFKEHDSFLGLASIQYTLTSTGHIFIDVDPQIQILSATLNSKEVLNSTHSGSYLYLNQSSRLGQNNLQIFYKGYYSTDGYGLVKFKHPSEDSLYFFSMLEPYSANRVFPLFDQPNLKGRMQLFIVHENNKKLSLVSNQQIDRQELFSTEIFSENFLDSPSNLSFQQQIPKNQMYVTIFKTTPYLPSYTISIISGQFAYQQFYYTSKDTTFPIRIFCPSPQLAILDEMLPLLTQLITEGISFFQSLFAKNYPYSKYDQVYVWDLNSKANQNAGSCIFSDKYLIDPKRSFPSSSVISICLTILHQIAHQWIGNCVTLQWWDDLWIQEGLVEFLAAFSLQRIKHQIKTIKIESTMDRRVDKFLRAIKEERSKESYPIYFINENTSRAQSNFHKNLISYTKSSMVFNQLVKLAGEQKFILFLREYIRKYSDGNANVDDFLRLIWAHFEKLPPLMIQIENYNMQKWKTIWLSEKGLSSVFITEWTYQDQQCTVFLTQFKQCFGSSQLKYQPFLINAVFIDKDCQIKDKLLFISEREKSTVSIKHKKPIKAIVLNYLALDYVETRIDNRSFEYLLNNIHRIADIHLKLHFWIELETRIGEQQIHPQFILQYLLSAIKVQKCQIVLQRMLKVLKCAWEQSRQEFQEELTYRIFYFLLNHFHAMPMKKLVVYQEKLIFFAKTKLSMCSLNTKSFYDKLNTVSKWKFLFKALKFGILTQSLTQKILAHQFPDYSSITFYNSLKFNAILADSETVINILKSIIHPHTSVTLKDKSIKALHYILDGLKKNRNFAEVELDLEKNLVEMLKNAFFQEKCKKCRKYILVFARYCCKGKKIRVEFLKNITNKENNDIQIIQGLKKWVRLI